MIRIPQRFSPPQQWSAIFLSHTQNIPFTIPPEDIYGTDSVTSHIPFPENWLAVQHSFPVTGDELRIRPVEEDSTQQSVYFCSWKNCTILVIYDSNILRSHDSMSEWHEKIDLLIVYNAAVRSIVDLRSVIRPLYTIVFCSSKDSDNIPRFTNLFTVSTDETETFLFKNNKNRPITLISQ